MEGGLPNRVLWRCEYSVACPICCTGFDALSTELRAPLMQRLFFRSGFRQLYLSVNHAFGILPMVISGFASPRQFTINPARSIAVSLRQVNNWHLHLVRSLEAVEFN